MTEWMDRSWETGQQALILQHARRKNRERVAEHPSLVLLFILAVLQGERAEQQSLLESLFVFTAFVYAYLHFGRFTDPVTEVECILNPSPGPGNVPGSMHTYMCFFLIGEIVRGDLTSSPLP